MTLPFNPYVAGNPVGSGAGFVGRTDVQREVVQMLRRPHDSAIVLYGQRRIGKTSILQRLVAALAQQGPYCPVYFDLQDKASWDLERLLGGLAGTVSRSLGRPAPDLSPDPKAAFQDDWLPALLKSLDPGCMLVLLLDEFDVLADPQRKETARLFFGYLRGLLTMDPARLRFIFVIGRNVDDLDNIALSLLKGVPAQRVSLLNQEDSVAVVRLAEANGTLRWPDESVDSVWQLTTGHPFLTQQLCSQVWERAYDRVSDSTAAEAPQVRPADVTAAVPDTLEASRNMFQWLWDGLPPAERVVAAALAGAGTQPITQEELERLLHESGVRVVIRELQNAPQLLKDWDLIEPVEGGYRFRVELLRRWIADHKPLRRVQDELDRVEPVADSFYRAGLGLYESGQLDRAAETLGQAVELNPNHVGANQLLADILLAQNLPRKARKLLEALYQYQPAAARSRLVQALLREAQSDAGEPDWSDALTDGEPLLDAPNRRLAAYERILEIEPGQAEAAAGRRAIWQQWADRFRAEQDLPKALEAYRLAEAPERVAEMEQALRAEHLAAELQEITRLEQEHHYLEALQHAQALAHDRPDTRDWAPDLERLQRKASLADVYARAVIAYHGNDNALAKTLLAQVVGVDPDYEQATDLLFAIKHGRPANGSAPVAESGTVVALPPGLSAAGAEAEQAGKDVERPPDAATVAPAATTDIRRRRFALADGTSLWFIVMAAAVVAGIMTISGRLSYETTTQIFVVAGIIIGASALAGWFLGPLGGGLAVASGVGLSMLLGLSSGPSGLGAVASGIAAVIGAIAAGSMGRTPGWRWGRVVLSLWFVLCYGLYVRAYANDGYEYAPALTHTLAFASGVVLWILPTRGWIAQMMASPRPAVAAAGVLAGIWMLGTTALLATQALGAQFGAWQVVLDQEKIWTESIGLTLVAAVLSMTAIALLRRSKSPSVLMSLPHARRLANQTRFSQEPVSEP